MGRYYSGDIEGKFWFAVQSSNDADFFGVEGQPNYLNYYFDEDNLADVEKGIQQCLKKLGDDKERFDSFFNDNESYNDKTISEYMKEKYDLIMGERYIHLQLQWYARLQLGQKIYDCIKENGECNFEAEL